jgi:hypothetical protein
MRMLFVLAMRVASYWWVTVLNPVHASVVNGLPFNKLSIFSSTKSPSKSDRIVDMPLVVIPGRPGWNQNVTSTSQVPHMATRRPCSGSAAALRVVAAIALAAISAVINRIRERVIIDY